MKIEYINEKTGRNEFSFEFRSLVYFYLALHPGETKTSIGRRFHLNATSMARATSVDDRMRKGLIIPWEEVITRELLEELDFAALEEELSNMKKARPKMRKWAIESLGWDTDQDWLIQKKIADFLLEQGERWTFKKEYSKQLSDQYFSPMEYAFDFVGRNDSGGYCICENVIADGISPEAVQVEAKFTQVLLRFGFLSRIKNPIQVILVCRSVDVFSLITSNDCQRKLFVVPENIKLSAMLVIDEESSVIEYRYPVVK